MSLKSLLLYTPQHDGKSHLSVPLILIMQLLFKAVDISLHLISLDMCLFKLSLKVTDVLLRSISSRLFSSLCSRLLCCKVIRKSSKLCFKFVDLYTCKDDKSQMINPSNISDTTCCACESLRPLNTDLAKLCGQH